MLIIKTYNTLKKVWWYLLLILFYIYSKLKQLVWYIVIVLRFFPKLNRNIQLIIIILFIPVLLIFVFLYGMYFYLSSSVDNNILDFYVDLHKYRTAIAIRDRDNNLIGTIPNPLPPPNKDLNSENTREGVLYVEDIPPIFWDFLMAREDRYLDFKNSEPKFWDLIFKKRSYKGINLMSIIHRVSQSQGGGSSLINLIIKNIYGQRYFKNKYGDTFLGKFIRKFYEFQGARHLFPYLATNEGIEFKRWISMHVPLLVAQGDVYGIQAFSATIFGKKPTKLTKGEQAILAAAYLHNARFMPLSPNKKSTDSQKSIDRKKRWIKIIKSAKEVVRYVYQEKYSDTYEAIIEELRNFKYPNKPHVPYSFRISDKSFNEKEAYGNLKKRAEIVIPGVRNLIRSQVEVFYKTLPNNVILTQAKITLPVAKNYFFKRRIDKVLKELQRKISFNKNIVLIPSKESKNINQKQAQIRIVVAKLNGEIIRYYRRGNFLEENNDYFKDGRYRASRPMASIAKIPAAVILGYLGDQPNSRIYCNKKYKKDGKRFKNASGPHEYGVKNCKKGMYTPTETFAASRNLPLHYALSEKHKLSKTDLIQLYKAFGIYTQTSQELLVNGLSFGFAETTPMQTHRIIHELTAILYNDNVAKEPFFIASFKISKRNLKTNDSKIISVPYVTQKNINIDRYLKKDSAKTFVKTVLSAPIYFKTGTLRSFQMIKNVKFLLAKSGTHTTINGNIKDKWVVGSMIVNGKIYTFSVLVGVSEFDGNGLAKKVRHSQLMMPIVREIVKSL
jgi:membrane peptidoglycan carboxypeptidase